MFTLEGARGDPCFFADVCMALGSVGDELMDRSLACLFARGCRLFDLFFPFFAAAWFVRFADFGRIWRFYEVCEMCSCAEVECKVSFLRISKITAAALERGT